MGTPSLTGADVYVSCLYLGYREIEIVGHNETVYKLVSA